MCGIVGLYLKTDRHHGELGRLTALMLHEMRDRGPDSAGFSIYGEPVAATKLTVLAEGAVVDWGEVRGRLGTAIEADVTA